MSVWLHNGPSTRPQSVLIRRCCSVHTVTMRRLRRAPPLPVEPEPVFAVDQRIVAEAADAEVEATGPAVQEVGPAATADVVGAIFAEDSIVAPAGHGRVVAGAEADAIAATAAEDDIVSAESHDHVVSARADQEVVSFGPDESCRQPVTGELR